MINIAELLKDCPKGMELDCTLFEKPVKYMELSKNGTYPIIIKTSCDKAFYLTKEGYLYDMADSQCIIFPKGKTTWEGFVPPCKFNDGDIITKGRGSICIYKGPMYYNNNLVDFYCGYRITDSVLVLKDCKNEHFGDIDDYHLATEEEKAKFFQAIKDNGYKWNAETKTLEKVEPIFKAGDRIAHKNGITKPFTISRVGDGYYYANEPNAVGTIRIEDQDNYELVPNKFNITTLIPFESRVLVRDSEMGIWVPEFFACLCDSHECPYMIIGGTRWKCCIPFEGNEHLMCKTDDCSEYYKTWE